MTKDAQKAQSTGKPKNLAGETHKRRRHVTFKRRVVNKHSLHASHSFAF